MTRTGQPYWNAMEQRPRAYTSIVCITESSEKFHGLCYCSRRGEIIDPITARTAEPVIGRLAGWRYDRGSHA